MAFSSGARACIGRRFAEVESIAVLVMIISRYELHLKPDPKYEHESPQETQKRILKSHVNLSFRYVARCTLGSGVHSDVPMNH